MTFISLALQSARGKQAVCRCSPLSLTTPTYGSLELQVNMREAECARSNLAEDLSRLRMELEKVISLSLFAVVQGSL